MTTPYADPQGLHNPATGNSPPASWGDNVRDNLQTLSAPPGCTVVTNAGQAIPDANFATPLVFAGADVRDTDAYHDTATNNTRMTVPTGLGGVYRLTASIEWEPTWTAPGYRWLGYRVNAGAVTNLSSLIVTVTTIYGTVLNGSVEISLNSGDYVEIIPFHADTGVTRNTLSARASLTWIGRA